jgi:hypothetical protein
MKIKLKEIDLSKRCVPPGGGSVRNILCWHPDINLEKYYLLKDQDIYRVGTFSANCFGYSLHVGDYFLQLHRLEISDKLWEIVELDDFRAAISEAAEKE